MAQPRPLHEATLSFLRSPSAANITSWQREALATWAWPPGQVPRESDFALVLLVLKMVQPRTPRKPLARTLAYKRVCKRAD